MLVVRIAAPIAQVLNGLALLHHHIYYHLITLLNNDNKNGDHGGRMKVETVFAKAALHLKLLDNDEPLSGLHSTTLLLHLIGLDHKETQSHRVVGS